MTIDGKQLGNSFAAHDASNNVLDVVVDTKFDRNFLVEYS